MPRGGRLIVSMRDRKLLRLENGRLDTVADMASLMPGDANDMVVDLHGRAFIGNFGFDLFAGAEHKPACSRSRRPRRKGAHRRRGHRVPQRHGDHAVPQDPDRRRVFRKSANGLQLGGRWLALRPTFLRPPRRPHARRDLSRRGRSGLGFVLRTGRVHPRLGGRRHPGARGGPGPAGGRLHARR